MVGSKYQNLLKHSNHGKLYHTFQDGFSEIIFDCFEICIAREKNGNINANNVSKLMCIRLKFDRMEQNAQRCS